jgi:hypothetical protein
MRDLSKLQGFAEGAIITGRIVEPPSNLPEPAPVKSTTLILHPIVNRPAPVVKPSARGCIDTALRMNVPEALAVLVSIVGIVGWNWR